MSRDNNGVLEYFDIGADDFKPITKEYIDHLEVLRRFVGELHYHFAVGNKSLSIDDLNDLRAKIGWGNVDYGSD